MRKVSKAALNVFVDCLMKVIRVAELEHCRKQSWWKKPYWYLRYWWFQKKEESDD